jgi:hypothetical protein
MASDPFLEVVWSAIQVSASPVAVKVVPGSWSCEDPEARGSGELRYLRARRRRRRRNRKRGERRDQGHVCRAGRWGDVQERPPACHLGSAFSDLRVSPP